MSKDDLRQLDNHFAFGENWKSFAANLSEDNINEAVRGLAKLFPADELRNRSILDIGCGSGLSMLAAIRLGARSVTGIDIDPNSVETARAVLIRHADGKKWHTQVASVFDFVPANDETYDVVHSWGVLHHTGDMRAAIHKSGALVARNGYFALALYRKTPMCGFWLAEKKFYSQSNRYVQAAIGFVYRMLFCLGLLARGRNPIAYIRNYKSTRGMDWSHDVHDWLGGYPYESVTPKEVSDLLAEQGFKIVRAFEKPAAIGGLLGSHCDEYVAIRRA